MAGEIIVLDPTIDQDLSTTYGAATTQLMLSGDEINGISLLEHAYPHPENEQQWAASVETEGARRGSTRPLNRQITARIRVAEPAAAAGTNRVLNPRFARETTSSWSTISIVTGSLVTPPAGLPATFETAWHVTTNAAADRVETNADVTNAVPDEWSIWVYVVSGNVRLHVRDSGAVSRATSANLATGTWVRATLPFTPNATGSWAFSVEQNGAGTADYYVTGGMVGTSGEYFDGDTAGAYWTGTPHSSTSARWGTGGDRFNALRQDINGKIAELNRNGGTYRRTLPNGDRIRFEVLAARVADQADDKRAATNGRTEMTLEFDCAPYGVEDEITLTAHTETTLPVLTFTETGIRGDVPALGRLVVTSPVDQGYIVWGAEATSAGYAANPETAVFYEAESFTPIAATVNASVAAKAGASGGNWILATTLQTSLFPIFDTGYMAHVGAYRVIARVQAPNTNAGTVSLQWGNAQSIGGNYSLSSVVEFDPAHENTWRLIDFGVMNRSTPIVGSARWYGRMYGMSTSAGDDIGIDWIMFVPIEDGDGQAYSPNYSVIYAGRNIEIRHDGVALSPDGVVYYPPATYEGDYLRVPPGTVRFAVKTSAGYSFPRTADSAIDDVTATLSYTPRWLSVPAPS